MRIHIGQVTQLLVAREEIPMHGMNTITGSVPLWLSM